MTDLDKAAALAARLTRARELAPKLSDATDRLNVSLARAEHQFAALKLGVSAVIELSPEGDDGEYELLAFKKQGAEWKFVVMTGREPDGYDSESLLLKESKDVRLRAAEVLDQLLEELIHIAESQTEVVHSAIAKVDGLVEMLARAAEQVEPAPFQMGKRLRHMHPNPDVVVAQSGVGDSKDPPVLVGRLIGPKGVEPVGDAGSGVIHKQGTVTVVDNFQGRKPGKGP